MDIKKVFFWFHEHPELPYQEYRTTAKIAELLKTTGAEILETDLETGLIAVIRGKEEGPAIALRSDIDALPIEEETDLEYKSRNPGVMHACGHDFHITSLLGAADILARRKDEIKGRIYLIFQPAEEAPGGAKKVLQTGVLKDVREYFAIHTSPDHMPGTVGIRKGAVMASVDRFQIHVNGKGSHAGHPDQGIDPIVAAAAIVQNVQTIVSRNIEPFSPGLVSITHIEGGNTWNVIPQTVYMEGTVRSLSPDVRIQIKKRLDEIAVHTAAAYGAEAVTEWYEGPPAVINDEELIKTAERAAETAGLIAEDTQPSLAGEDFSYYLENARGVFVRMGTGGAYPNHHPKFTVSCDALEKSAVFLAEAALNLIERHH